MLLLWILYSLFVPAFLVSDPNCLRANPEVLDAEFSIFNRYGIRWNVTTDDIAKHAALISKRYKRSHGLSRITLHQLKRMGDGICLYQKSSKKRFVMYVTVEGKLVSDLEEGISQYKEIHHEVMNFNSRKDCPMFGVYLPLSLLNSTHELIAVESTFGYKENTTIPVGVIILCFHNNEFSNKDKEFIRLLQRLNFLTCVIKPKKNPSPEGSADQVIATCDDLKRDAVRINITAEIMCVVGFPTYDSSPEGVVGTVSNFQRFWCRVANEINRNKSHAQIIMESAFDGPPYLKLDAGRGPKADSYHRGWWRSKNINSNNAMAFVEKVEELEGGREYGNCINECDYCSTFEECCGGTICEFDPSYQPFEYGKLVRVCLPSEVNCSPRLPKNTTSTKPTKMPTKTSPSETGNTSSTFSPVVIFIFLCLPLAGCACVTIFVLYRRRRTKVVFPQKEIDHLFEGSAFSNGGLLQCDVETNIGDKIIYEKKQEITQADFEIYEGQILGSGAFGLVLKGRIGNQDVAVKTTLPRVEKLYLKALVLELKVLIYLGTHENIVNLVGAHTSQLSSGKLYIFLELCPLGNLLQFLRTNRNCLSNLKEHEQFHPNESSESLLNSKHLLKWSTQIASALGHLADKRVIHGDVAARNVLVLSRDKEPLPWRHMSIEALKDLSFSVQSDVWSFGVTLWEIFSLGEVPYPGQSWSLSFLGLLKEGLRLQRPDHAHNQVYEIMSSCWTNDIQQRPQINLIYTNLIAALDEIHTSKLYICISHIDAQ